MAPKFGLNLRILLILFFFTISLSTVLGLSNSLEDGGGGGDPMKGVYRSKCSNRVGVIVKPVSIFQRRLRDLRTEMQTRASVQGAELDAYIVTSFDDHQSEFVAEEDKRRQWLTGFNGTNADLVVTMRKSAIWTDDRFLQQADAELDCDWLLFRMGDFPSVAEWLGNELAPESMVGADPQTVPHYLWAEWEYELSLKYIRLMRINRNLIDAVWGSDRPLPHNDELKVQPLVYAGERWESKVAKLRQNISANGCDAMVVTSLTEIAYLLNLRGTDIPYVPVFKSYMIITQSDIFLYVNQTRIGLGIQLHLKSEPCHHDNCVQVRAYDQVWRDLRTLSQAWKRVLVPAICVYDMGASQAIYSALRKEIVSLRISPIIYMRAQKTDAERRGMFNAHIRDAAAMCEVLSYLEEKFMMGDHYTEMKLSNEIDLTRRSQPLSHDISFQTTVAFGPHSSLIHYKPNNLTDTEITEEGMLVIDSGGQYQDGTTTLARTIHLGTPTAEQKKAYTLVLGAVIKLSMLRFPENIRLSDIDILPRSILWGDHNDYPHGSGHGVGSYLSVKESPINIAYSAKHRYTFKDGYFFSNEPAFYKLKDFGVKLKNVMEVYDTGKVHPSGRKFLAFKDVTLVPFETKLINPLLLSSDEKKWINEYNAKVREFVGEELKKRVNMPAFYWMMNKTKHLPEYLPEETYRRGSAHALACDLKILAIVSSLLLGAVSRFLFQ